MEVFKNFHKKGFFYAWLEINVSFFVWKFLKQNQLVYISESIQQLLLNKEKGTEIHKNNFFFCFFYMSPISERPGVNLKT